MSFGSELKRRQINGCFGKTPGFTPPANIFVSPHTADPGEDGRTAGPGKRAQWTENLRAEVRT